MKYWQVMTLFAITAAIYIHLFAPSRFGPVIGAFAVVVFSVYIKEKFYVTKKD